MEEVEKIINLCESLDIVVDMEWLIIIYCKYI